MAAGDKIIWVGTTATWTTAANWSPAAAPVDTESPTFTGAVTQNIDGLTLGAGADDFQEVWVHEDMAHDIGSSGTPVTAGNVTSKMQYSSRAGRMYWNTANAKTLALCTYKASSGRPDALRLGGAGTVTTLRIHNASGGLTLTGVACTTIEMTNSPNATLTIESSVTGLEFIRILGGGTIDNSAVVTTNTGTVTINNGRYIRRGTGTIDRLEMYGSGGVNSIIEDYASGAISGGIMSGKGARIDGTGNRSTGAITVALSAFDGAKILADNGFANYALTVTTDGTATIDAGTATITYL